MAEHLLHKNTAAVYTITRPFLLRTAITSANTSTTLPNNQRHRINCSAMKRPLISCYDHFMFPTGEDEDRALQVEVMEFGLEDDECVGNGGEKKRRLRVEQVRALEKSFELDNKLDPERKAKLALEVGLQPRQVAVWFQNRRARWKGKRLEHDYASLKASYDALRTQFDCLQRDKESLVAKIEKLKAKLAEDERLRIDCVFVETDKIAEVSDELPFLLCKDAGSAESDSSAVLNDECRQFESPVDASDHMFFSLGASIGLIGSETACCSIVNCKLEECELIGGDEEPCRDFFSDEQDPSLNCIDRWWQ